MTTTTANPTYDFEGQVALVTGASSGMGPVDGGYTAAGSTEIVRRVSEGYCE